METTSYFRRWQNSDHDRRDPNPFLALYLDNGIPMDTEAKAALLNGLSSRGRQFLLPVVRPLARFCIVFNQLWKILIPNALTSSFILHQSIYRGLKWFVAPEANYLILRHFWLGSEILAFIRDNVGATDLAMSPLKPKTLKEVKDDIFLNHDLNLFNFVIDLNRKMKEQGTEISPPTKINFQSITDGPLDIEPMPNRFLNIIDLETAIDIYTPLYQVFLTDHDFWRATNSLQLDETIGIYCSKILGNDSRMWAVNNKHPLVPMTTLRAGNRLMLHGLATEQLHYHLRLAKRAAAKQ